MVLYEWITVAPDVNDDLAVNEEKVNEANYNRSLVGIAVSGGTAAFDSFVEVYSAGILLARCGNGKTGDTLVDNSEYKECGSMPIPKGKALICKLVLDGGNNITVGLEIVP